MVKEFLVSLATGEAQTHKPKVLALPSKPASQATSKVITSVATVPAEPILFHSQQPLRMKVMTNVKPCL